MFKAQQRTPPVLGRCYSASCRRGSQMCFSSSCLKQRASLPGSPQSQQDTVVVVPFALQQKELLVNQHYLTNDQLELDARVPESMAEQGRPKRATARAALMTMRSSEAPIKRLVTQESPKALTAQPRTSWSLDAVKRELAQDPTHLLPSRALVSFLLTWFCLPGALCCATNQSCHVGLCHSVPTNHFDLTHSFVYWVAKEAVGDCLALCIRVKLCS